jgi:hypothetical protein
MGREAAYYGRYSPVVEAKVRDFRFLAPKNP